AQYALRLTGRSSEHAAVWAAFAIGAVAVVNYVGVKPGSRLLNLLVILKLAALVILIGGGLLLPRASAASPEAPAAAASSAGLLSFGAALVPILFSYGGCVKGSMLAGEAPGRHTAPPLRL